MEIDQNAVGTTLSFQTFDGAQYKNLKLLALLDSGTVVALGYDAVAGHHSQYPYLPPGTPDNFQQYMYGKFVDANQAITYLGVPWIKPSSVVANENPNYVLLLRNPTPQQVDSVRSMLIASGIEDFEITVQ